MDSIVRSRRTVGVCYYIILVSRSTFIFLVNFYFMYFFTRFLLLRVSKYLKHILQLNIHMMFTLCVIIFSGQLVGGEARSQQPVSTITAATVRATCRSPPLPWGVIRSHLSAPQLLETCWTHPCIPEVSKV